MTLRTPKIHCRPFDGLNLGAADQDRLLPPGQIRAQIMPHKANDNLPAQLPPPIGEPDAHGQAALILAEATLHALVDMKTMTRTDGLEVVHSAEAIKTEVAAMSGESETRMRESLELLKRIGVSLDKDSD